MEQKLTIPEGYNIVMTYLIINDCAKFITFVNTVFGATEKMRHMLDETTIVHSEITIGDITIMMADATKDWEPRTAGFFIYVDDADATYQLALDNGATSIHPPTNQMYGRSGGVNDPFGNTWWITSVIE